MAMSMDTSGQFVVSYLAWADEGRVWRFDTVRGQVEAIRVSEADRLEVMEWGDGEVAMIHGFGSERVEITTHTCVDLARATRRVVLEDGRAVVDHRGGSWGDETSCFALPDDAPASGVLGPVVVVVQGREAEWTRLGWSESYDSLYQSLGGVGYVPESGELVFGVQRSSNLVVTSGDGSRVVRKVPLAGRGGNPDPYVCCHGSEVWAVDFDVVVSVDRVSWETRAACAVPTTSPSGVAQSLGDLWVPGNESVLVVPRTGTGEVFGLSPVGLSRVGVAVVGGRPIQAVVLPSSRVIARDWMSGRLLEGEMVAV